MTNVVFKDKQNVATIVDDVENGFTVQVLTREAGSSTVYTHVFSSSFNLLEQELLKRGVKQVLAGSYNGVSDQNVVIEQVNKVFSNLQEGKVTCRVAGTGSSITKVNKDKPVAKLSYLLQAVLASYPEVTQEMWATFSKEERASYKTADVLKLARKIEVTAVAKMYEEEEQTASEQVA